jgi:hypothetical protein
MTSYFTARPIYRSKLHWKSSINYTFENIIKPKSEALAYSFIFVIKINALTFCVRSNLSSYIEFYVNNLVIIH